MTPSSDQTPPVIVPIVTGPRGANGWYVGDVAIAFEIHDPESPFIAGPGCEARTVAVDNAAMEIICEATSGGGTASAAVVIARDATAPVVTALLASPGALLASCLRAKILACTYDTGCFW